MKLSWINATLFIVFLLPSCVSKSEPIVKEDNFSPYKLYDLYYDRYGNGGIVVFQCKWFATVLSLDEDSLSWGPMNELVYISDTLIIDNNLYYTQCEYSLIMLESMLSRGIERYPAMEWCNKKNRSLPNSGSWRLPTYKEYVWIRETSPLTIINSAIGKAGGTPINENELYWTCVEDYNDYITFKDIKTDYNAKDRVICLTYNGHSTSNKKIWEKSNKHLVRAIKYIPIE